MKTKHLLPLALALTSLAGFAAGQTSTAGTITFSGKVVAQPCTIDTSTSTQTVTLQTVNTTNFSAIGDTAALQNFNLKFTNCTYYANATNKLQVAWNGTADATVNTTFNNGASTGKATGVSLQVKEATSDSNVTLDSANAIGTVVTPTFTSKYTLGSGLTGTQAVTLTYSVAYYATAAAVGAGTVSAAVPIAISFP
ncbi:type 1 fimbrial protein [Burkholderiaceae bacterium DAT-1]|nr:type 1 fimbrial protein [Burkholderiaceae bacterium DAT-1]